MSYLKIQMRCRFLSAIYLQNMVSCSMCQLCSFCVPFAIPCLGMTTIGPYNATCTSALAGMTDFSSDCICAFVCALASARPTAGISQKLKSYTSVQKFLKDVKFILKNCREYNEGVDGEQGQAEFIELANLMEKQAEELCAQVCMLSIVYSALLASLGAPHLC